MHRDALQRLSFPFFVLFLVLLFSGCDQMMAPVRSTPPILSSQARVYLTQALDIMQQHSIRRKEVNWTRLRQEAFAEANHAKTPADTYPAITHALQLSGDPHSFFHEPRSTSQPGADVPPSVQEPFGQRLADGIGYLNLPEFPPHYEGSGQAGKQYALLAQETIRTTDQTATCGWIVDVRNNPGGTLWPMLVGVGPILGEGVVGAFVSPDGSKQQWIYRNGQALLDQEIQMAITPVYHLKRPLPPVAVLTNNGTGSSAEAITVAFRGRIHARSFGAPTVGVPTANDGYLLSDGAVIELTTALDADRTGQTYDGPIPPDQEVPFARLSPPLADDHVVQTALTWLRTQKGCQS